MCSDVEAQGWIERCTSSLSGEALRLVLAVFRTSPEDQSNEAGHKSGELNEKPSFESVLQLFHKKIYNLTYRLVDNADEAADLTQETFVKAYKAYPRFEGTSEAVYPWLCRIAVNGCKNRFRDAERRHQYESASLDNPVYTEDSETGVEISDGSMDPVDIFERRELEAKVQEAIQVLPPEYRVVVVLRDMQELSYKEIADATGLSMETVKVRLFRGRGLIRRRLAPYISI